MIRILNLALFLLLVVFTTEAAYSAASEWQDLGGGKARLLTVLDPTSGKVRAAVEVKLEPGWTTYWRYPGSSGIPPVFDFSGSNGFQADKVAFPAPELLGNGQLKYAGYKKSVTFPVDGKVFPGINAEINLELLIGVCAEICIPAQAKMKITSDELEQSDPLANQIILLAKKAVPEPTDPDDVLISTSVRNDGNLMILIHNKVEGGIPELFVEGPADWYLQPAKLVSQGNNKSLFALNVSNAPEGSDILAEKLVYTLVYGSDSVEFVR
ncbi:MAG: protein-disulfide reductase DsbD domain-containing protein [Rhizobiaceae bacterium]